MPEFEFTLRFDVSRVASSTDEQLELLPAHGCDDATIGVGIAGRLALAFARDSDTAADAVSSALADVLSALPEATFVEASPDYVGITEVAEMVGKTRQNIRKLMVGCRTGVPTPVHEGSPSIWHLAPVLQWLHDEKHYTIEQHLLDLAVYNMQLNVTAAGSSVDPRTKNAIESLVAEA